MFGPLAGTLLTSWDEHCKREKLTWTISEPRIQNVIGMSEKFFCLAEAAKTNKAFLDALVLREPNSSNFAPRFVAQMHSDTELFGVYWIHFTVKERWILKDTTTGQQLFTSPEHHSNHHLWKLFTPIPNIDWRVIDIDNQVRTRLAMLGTPKELLNKYDLGPVEAWSHFQ